jgi:saccharopine dehydrogenase-like NADP-dependent oxidoreductase
MRIILIIGAGRSASSLIQYLLDKSEKKIYIIIGDLSMSLAENKTSNHPNATPIALDILMKDRCDSKADIVIPCYRRIYILKWPEIVLSTRKLGYRFYVSEAMQELDADVKENNLVFMNEIGLDQD